MEKKSIDVKGILKELDEAADKLVEQDIISYGENFAIPFESFRNQLDNSCVEFLKQNGYRPKMTRDYFKSLAQRLKKKGLKIGYVITNQKNIFDEKTCSYQWSGVISWYVVSIYVDETKMRELLEKGKVNGKY